MTNFTAKHEKLRGLVRGLLDSSEKSYGLEAALKTLREEIDIYENFSKESQIIDKKILTLNTKMIQFGGGTHVLEGYLNVDVFPPADVLWDVREKLPFSDECCESIFSEHMLEHLFYPRAKVWISECFRILKKGSQIIVGVPNAGKAMEAYVNRDNAYLGELRDKWYKKRKGLDNYNNLIDMANLVSYDQENDDHYHRHYWGYDYDKLSSILVEAGFSSVEPWKFDSQVANPSREWGSVYVLGIK